MTTLVLPQESQNHRKVILEDGKTRNTNSKKVLSRPLAEREKKHWV